MGYEVSVWEDRYCGLHNVNYPTYECADHTLSGTAVNLLQQRVERVRGQGRGIQVVSEYLSFLFVESSQGVMTAFLGVK